MFTGLDWAATKFGVVLGLTRHGHDRRFPPQQFLNNEWNARRVARDGAAKLCVLGEVAEKAVKRGGYGVQPGDEEQKADVEDLVTGKAVPVDLGFKKPAQQVIARLGLAVLEGLSTIPDTLPDDLVAEFDGDLVSR